MASVTRSTSWAGRLCWNVCKYNTTSTKVTHTINPCLLLVKRLPVAELFFWTKIIDVHHFGARTLYADLCHPVGYEGFSVGGVRIPEDTLKRKSPEKVFHHNWQAWGWSLLNGFKFTQRIQVYSKDSKDSSLLKGFEAKGLKLPPCEGVCWPAGAVVNLQHVLGLKI